MRRWWQEGKRESKPRLPTCFLVAESELNQKDDDKSRIKTSFHLPLSNSYFSLPSPLPTPHRTQSPLSSLTRYNNKRFTRLTQKN